MKKQNVPESYQQWIVFRRVAWGLGCAIFMLSGLSVLWQTVAADFLPPLDGYVQTQAVVTSVQQRGTFRNPSFSVTLAYDVPTQENTFEELRSGQRVPFEAYNVLAEGDVITVYYDPDNVYNWRLSSSLHNQTADFYAWEFLLMVIGVFVIATPMLLRFALRMDDFDFNQDLNVTTG